MTTPAAIDVRRLSRRFGDFVAVDALSFQVKPGEIFGFLGPNGAGKSTTIRMLCGILRTHRRQRHGGRLRHRHPGRGDQAAIGYMSQKFSLYEDLTVEENIDFYSGIYRIPAARKKARKSG